MLFAPLDSSRGLHFKTVIGGLTEVAHCQRFLAQKEYNRQPDPHHCSGPPGQQTG
jgi:hypothetical protein